MEKKRGFISLKNVCIRIPHYIWLRHAYVIYIAVNQGVACLAPEKPKTKQVRKPQATATGMISLASDSPSKSRKSPKKKGKKSSECSSEESDAFIEDSSCSDGDLNTSITDILQRDKAPRRAAGMNGLQLQSDHIDCAYIIILKFLAFIFID
jgi:hypothetical protein